MSAAARRWHHAVLTTYGVWLSGDERGFRARHHRAHVDGDYRQPPPGEEFRAWREHSRDSLTQGVVTLPDPLRPVVGQALHERLAGLGAWVLCTSVGGQHAHVLVKLPVGTARHWLGLAKKHAWFVLRQQGWQAKLWATRSRATLVRSRAHQIHAYRYILRHADQGAWVGVWKEEPGAKE